MGKNKCGCDGTIVMSGAGIDKAGRWQGLHGWTHISLRYLHILAKEYYRAGPESWPRLFLGGELSVHLFFGL